MALAVCCCRTLIQSASFGDSDTAAYIKDDTSSADQNPMEIKKEPTVCGTEMSSSEVGSVPLSDFSSIAVRITRLVGTLANRAAKGCGVAQHLFDTEQLVVFTDTVGTAGRTGFDLTCSKRHCEISDRCVFGFT